MMKIDYFVNLVIGCPFCGNDHSVDIFLSDYEEFEKGAYIQDAFPYLTLTQREQLITHLCPKCQEEMEVFDEE